MARLRRDTLSASSTTHSPTSTHASSPMPSPSNSKPFRIFSTGTIFFTYSLDLCSHPVPGTVSRAQAVAAARGGSAGHILGFLAALPAAVEPMLIASLGASPDGIRLRDELEAGGIRTKYCKPWPGLGVPSAWVMHARDTGERTVINHNPLPEMSHEDFIALLGPVLAPENYVGISHSQPPQLPPQPPSPASVFPNAFVATPPPRPSMTSRPATAPTGSAAPHMAIVPTQSPLSPAPFDWLHFEGRNIKTTLSNILGIDGLARERKWRAYCVLSLDLGRRAREGVEALIPHADVIFLSAQTFPSLSSPGPPSPRAILLALARHARPHALLVLYGGTLGSALLSLPTREYLQSSSWSPLPIGRSHAHTSSNLHSIISTSDGVESVRSGSEFWAGRRSPDSSGFTIASAGNRDSGYSEAHDDEPKGRTMTRSLRIPPAGHPCPTHFLTLIFTLTAIATVTHTHVPPQHVQSSIPVQPLPPLSEDAQDEEGAHSAFVAGMIWSLSRRILPGAPYTPMQAEEKEVDVTARWRLDECLRFATECAGRKAGGCEWGNLALEMRDVGWFD
ncbi:hypothetical protein DFJ58DRAFT_731476 [Suillus subalutaceus]|uniref:uncharacterized protein n=1 Tax=Suillus subalutaceus TaxID=48586 RepID=UPI001B87EB79|nr:uncharacterized protein DFJ58DRAFT_731476 [Suillus subalutaceus]KAG1843808.1 hypothetical protein DFJ58DRAFT_731476 [Suillus subalutaceus]